MIRPPSLTEGSPAGLMGRALANAWSDPYSRYNARMRCVLVLVGVFVFGCGSSSGHGGGGSGGEAGGTGESGATSASAGGSSATVGGSAGVAGQTGAGGAIVGGSGGTLTGGASAGGSGGRSTSASGGTSTVASGTPGDPCNYTDTTSKVNALKDTDCDTGYCLWDSRYFAGSYCTIPCTLGGACPKGFECVADARVANKSWCARTAPPTPTDMGATCDSDYLPDCTLSSGLHMNFCLIAGAPECKDEDGYCVYDGASKSAYCSAPCRDPNVPCPTGWDCWHNPGARNSLHDACMKHHPPAELVGLSCHQGGSFSCQEGVACIGIESGPVPSCAPTGGICMVDLRPGAPVATREYCSMRCETDPCPAGYECLAASMSGGLTPNGKYCFRQLPAP